jgi:hypothetical protein
VAGEVMQGFSDMISMNELENVFDGGVNIAEMFK